MSTIFKKIHLRAEQFDSGVPGCYYTIMLA
jgi:hypothetical protein